MKYLWILSTLVLLTATAPTAEAKAPTGRFVVDAKGETAYDNWTKLTWQRAVDAATYSWANAKTYCSALALSGGGWHLPDVRELRSIVDRQQFSPAIDPTAFPATPTTYFWSSTAYSGSASSAGSVYFGNGNSNYFGITATYRVRCVR